MAIIVEASNKPKKVGNPAYREIAGIIPSLADCFACSIDKRSLFSICDCALKTKSGMIPFVIATNPVSPSIAITDSKMMTPKIQKNTGEYFNSAQGGLYSSKKIGNIFKKLEKAGYLGYGQTSWGPTGFVFCKNDNEKKKIFSILKREININNYNSLSLHQVTGRNRGYYISKSNKKI